MILLLRNPKDVAVSFYHHVKGIKFYEYAGKFENFLKMFQNGEGASFCQNYSKAFFPEFSDSYG